MALMIYNICLSVYLSVYLSICLSISKVWFQGLGGPSTEAVVMVMLALSFVLKEVTDQCRGFMLFQVGRTTTTKHRVFGF
jgi:hypothetical protein